MSSKLKLKIVIGFLVRKKVNGQYEITDIQTLKSIKELIDYIY